MGSVGPGHYDTNFKTINNNDSAKVTIRGKSKE
jgi:hypothetical protein